MGVVPVPVVAPQRAVEPFTDPPPTMHSLPGVCPRPKAPTRPKAPRMPADRWLPKGPKLPTERSGSGSFRRPREQKPPTKRSNR